jgi:uncharacterized protein YecT (DUF1311 family)
MKSHLVFLSLVISASAAHADVASDVAAIRQNATNCSGSANSNVELKDCAGNEATQADAALKKYYQKALADLKVSSEQELKAGAPPAYEGSPEISKRLEASQKAWLTYRGANCDFEATEMLGGTGESLVSSNCYAEATLDRILEISKVLNPESN